MLRPYPLCVVLLLYLCPLQAQSDLRIGEWGAFLPFRIGNTVTQDDQKVYFGSQNGLVAIRKEDMQPAFFSKVNGLNDVGIRLIRYHHAYDALIIVYQNSNIDLIFRQGTVLISDVRTTTAVTGSKVINDVYVDHTEKVYFSCAFGLLEFNMHTLRFGFTMFTPSPVNTFVIHDGAFYAGTDNGLYRFNRFADGLVADFGAWQRLSAAEGLPAQYRCTALTVYDDRLYAGTDEDLYRLESEDFILWDTREGHYVAFLSAEGSHLMAGFRCPGDVCNGKVHFYNASGKVGEHGFNCAGLPVYVIEDESGRLWYADEFPGFRTAAMRQHGCDHLEFNTPNTSGVSEIAIQDGIVYVATGGVSDSYNALNRRDGFLILRDGVWSYFNQFNTPELAQAGTQDYFRILPHPSGSPLYVGTYFAGLIEYDFETFTIHKKTNSILEGAVGDSQRERIAGLAFDSDENLWMSNFLSTHPIVVKKADGTWRKFPVPGGTQLGEVLIDRRGYKWFAVITVSEGVLVYDDGGTIDDLSDDRYKYFTISNSALTTNLLTNLTMDRNGDIWVGTREGPVIFGASEDPFSGTNHGYRIKVDQQGIIAYLLADEEITTIAIDGANRKWFGTRNGVFVQSPNGETQIAHYHTGNSPLLHNTIIDITIDDSNGNVYIGTEAGINILRAEAIAGGPFHRPAEVYAFPNPVHPDFEGPIAIRGLAEDAVVKITDIRGALVFETQALGGQAIWDGRDLTGRRATSGVYLVFSTTQPQFDKPDAIVTKILIVR